MQNVFCYGTLKNKDVQYNVLGRSVEGFTDSLEGHTTERIDIGGSLFLRAIPSANGELSGKRFACSESELQKIDEYEGKDYVRTKKILQSGIKAWIYVRPE